MVQYIDKLIIMKISDSYVAAVSITVSLLLLVCYGLNFGVSRT